MCEALFEKKGILEGADKDNELRIQVSYLEIYNEKLKDLLETKNRKKELKIYSTKKGILVKNLEKVYCATNEDV